ncbi:uncharacterized protein [Diabrotica undecimpunctata]|uniref:uncharacterized protein n=1 Tax=Diabrotica undecimpunctata TaxID=50387 RepID=UPI003B63FD65
MRTYKRKNENLRPFTDDVFMQAKHLKERGLSTREIGRTLGYDESTIRKRLKADRSVNFLGRFRPVFTPEQERQIVDHCKALDLRFYGLTLKSLRFLSYQFAERNGIQHQFSKQSKLAGRDWTRNFMKRNRLSLRTPRKTSVARTMGFNKHQLTQYFQNLKSVLEKYKFPANKIYNMDETGLQTVPNKLPKHVAPTGKKEVAKNVAAEQGRTVTAACSMSATGHYVPPFFIFARKRLNPLLIKDAPTGSVLAVTDSGYMNSVKFLQFLEHFRKYTNPSAESPVLLILDNHISHTTLEAITYAKNNNIHLLSLPPHSSHRTQPLDRNFFRPLKAYYDDLCDNWTTSNPGQVVTEYHVAGLFKQAYEKTATIEKAVNGFKMTGIFPLDENIFTEDFLSSSVTEQEQEEVNDLDRNNKDTQLRIVFDEDKSQENDKAELLNSKAEEASGEAEERNVENLPDRASISSNRESKPESSKNEMSTTLPSDIIPLPKLTKKRKRTRKGLKSTVLTSTPHKEQMEISELEKKYKINEKKRKESIKKNKNTVRKVFEEKQNILNKKEYEYSSDSDAQISLHDSSSNSSFSESDADNELSELSPGEFAIVKVYGKTKDSFRMYVMRITVIVDEGYSGIYYRRAPNTMRFSETEEEFFVNKTDIIRKLSKPLLGSSARFNDFVSFSTDLSDLMLH